MTITVYVQPDESISQALNRAMLIALPKENETIVILPGVHIIGDNVPQTRTNPSFGFRES